VTLNNIFDFNSFRLACTWSFMF